jgi:putative endonuclease
MSADVGTPPRGCHLDGRRRSEAPEEEWRDPEHASPARPIRGVLSKLLCYILCVRDGFHYKFWVYILSSRSGTLYAGITGFFEQRIHQHKYDSIDGFTKKHQCHRLVYYESYQDVQKAIDREKQVKRWRREKKIFLIEKMNPRWQDLAENWGREMRFRGQSLG